MCISDFNHSWKGASFYKHLFNIGSLLQDCSISIAIALEILHYDINIIVGKWCLTTYSSKKNQFQIGRELYMAHPK